MNYRKPYNGSKKRLSDIKRTVNLEEKETKKENDIRDESHFKSKKKSDKHNWFLKYLKNKLAEVPQSKMEKKSNKKFIARLIYVKKLNKSQCMYNWHFWRK